MTVKELMDRLAEFDPIALVTCCGTDDHPIKDSWNILDIFEIRGANQQEMNGVVLIYD